MQSAFGRRLAGLHILTNWTAKNKMGSQRLLLAFSGSTKVLTSINIGEFLGVNEEDMLWEDETQTAGDRRILMTRSVGDGYQTATEWKSHVIIRAFRKCGC